MDKFGLIMTIMKQIYGAFLRPLIVKAVEDPNEEWDDYLLSIIDRIFDYGG